MAAADRLASWQDREGSGTTRKESFHGDIAARSFFRTKSYEEPSSAGFFRFY